MRKLSMFTNVLDVISQRVEDNTKRITDAEHRVSDIEDTATSTEIKLSETEKLMLMLSEKVDDLERTGQGEKIYEY